MKDLKILKQSISFLEESKTICSANILSENQVVILFDTGEVVLYNISENKSEKLFSIEKFYLQSFDLQDKISIYLFQEIVILVNDFNTNGLIFNKKQNYFLSIERGDYCTEHSCFPIAFFENDEKTPFLIYGKDWNRIDILNLDTLHIITADKSVIEVGREQRYLDFYEQHPNLASEKRPYPSPFDYFYGKIILSPNGKEFLSKGWVWGSSDSYKVFDIQKFINNRRISFEFDFMAEHENRAACWIDDDTLAFGFDAEIEEDSGIEFFQEQMGETVFGSQYLLVIFRRKNGNFEFEKSFSVEKQVVNSEIYYDRHLKNFISYSQEGIVIFDLQGKIVLKENFAVKEYHSESKQFINFNEHEIEIYYLN